MKACMNDSGMSTAETAAFAVIVLNMDRFVLSRGIRADESRVYQYIEKIYHLFSGTSNMDFKYMRYSEPSSFGRIVSV